MAEKNLSREQKIQLYDKLVALHPDAERKGDTMPYTSLNGHMYSYFTKDDFMALKLPEAERGQFMAKYNTTLVTQYGIVQKEYVAVPDELLEDTEALSHWFAISYQYTLSLKPKPGKAKKKG